MSLEVEDSEAYKKIEKRIALLNLLKQYYGTGGNLYDFDSGEIPVRQLIAFMSDEGYPRRLVDAEHVLKKIDAEIIELEARKKNMRLQEMEDRNLNSLLIITSWTKLINTPTKGIYLNRPVVDLRRDTIIMLTDETQTFKELTDERTTVFVVHFIVEEKYIHQRKYITQTKKMLQLQNCQQYFHSISLNKLKQFKHMSGELSVEMFFTQTRMR
jgi:hypothetical protein